MGREGAGRSSGDRSNRRVALLPPAPGDSGGRPNGHVFYNLDVAKSVAADIADKLATIDPHNAADYRANAAKFAHSADAIAASEHAIATAHPRADVIATDPVAYYLLATSGLVNCAPPSFTAANHAGGRGRAGLPLAGRGDRRVGRLRRDLRRRRHRAVAAPGVPVSVFVATISFLIYLVCRLLERRKAGRHQVA